VEEKKAKVVERVVMPKAKEMEKLERMEKVKVKERKEEKKRMIVWLQL